MYGLVLAMALAGSAQAPECFWDCGDCGWGCSYSDCGWGGCYSGWGGCYSGNYCGYYPSYYGGCAYYSSPVVYQPIARASTPRATPATLVVTLPANAKLKIDNYTSSQTSAKRVLETPPIAAGKEFTYTLTASVNQDGENVTQTQRVTLRPGQQLPVRFDFSTTPTAARR